MGIRKTYQCNKCNYSADISGEPDSGMTICTNTYVCNKCKEVVDVVTEYLNDFSGDNIGKCPNCNSSEYLKIWNNKKRPCPKCGGKMDMPPEMMVTLWITLTFGLI